MSDIQECCGSGCNNCVLDSRGRVTNRSGKSFPGVNLFKDNKYIQFMVAGINKVTVSVYKFTFRYCGESHPNHILELPGGGYLMLRAPKNYTDRPLNPIFQVFSHQVMTSSYLDRSTTRNDSTTEDIFISRPYTPVATDQTSLQFTVLVKLEPLGAMSGYLKTLQPGDLVEWKGIYTKAEFDADQYHRIICFCHGVAVTTMVSIAKSLLVNDDLDTMIEVHAGFCDGQSILLRDDLGELNRYWNFKSVIYLSHVETCGSDNDDAEVVARFSETFVRGRIDRQKITAVVNGDEGARSEEKFLVLTCGTKLFTSSVDTVVSELECMKKSFNKILVL